MYLRVDGQFKCLRTSPAQLAAAQAQERHSRTYVPCRSVLVATIRDQFARNQGIKFYMAEQHVETVIIGAGPVGLFQIFELGLLGISTHIIDSLGAPGGQCTELYPDKPIYDIPGLPICGAQELINRLMEQAKPFNATFHLGQEVTELKVLPDGQIDLATSAGTRLIARAVVIATGIGSFQPRRLAVPNIEVFEGKSVHYHIKAASEYHGKDLVICGGGDSALDWAIALCGKANSLTLVHRRSEFRAAPATVSKMRE